MHIEIQVALNFVISYLYNKLPRRRVNLFGEELDKALKHKFSGHWYPEKPFKGSAFRCLRIGSPLDPVIEVAARESGVELNDIRENLPEELSIWVDPGEVSYRIGEKGAVKVLYAEADASDDGTLDKEVTRSFNPEAQCFKPIESVSSSLSNLAVSPNHAAGASAAAAAASSSATSPFGGNSPSPSFKSTSPINAFLPNKMVAPLTFTTATFAQTKFGSTKLKTSSKRSNRMSPIEFSNYIKQRAMQQQQQQQQQQPGSSSAIFGASQGPSSPQPPQRPRSLSPNPQSDQHFVFMPGTTNGHHHHHHHQQQQLRGLVDNNSYLGDLFGNAGPQGKFSTSAASDTAAPFLSAAAAAAAMGINDNSKTLLDGINFNLNTMPAYPNSHQHLLVAN